MHVNQEYLKKRGWSDAEIAHTTKIVDRIARHKHPHHDLLGETVFWTILFLAIATMIAVTYWIVPLFIALANNTFYPLLLIIGLAFGLLYNAVIKDMEHLKVHHHVLLIAAIPITTIISFTLILSRVNNLYTAHNTIIAGAVFAISFLAPYLLQQFIR